ncbi:uncharacterized protein [Palaemon carinicauda]|uniref:uncharacterized protein n=1 Tax=Palaemon carinicauda TaxID=392227 RepID=UPI0035B63A36
MAGLSQNKFIANPSWTIGNLINLPMSDNTSGGTRLRTAIQFTIIANMLLESLLVPSDENRPNIGLDQLNVFRSIEDSMGAMGVNGRECLLRLICELTSNPIGEFTVIGEIITVLFTPKRGMNEFLQEYIDAEIAGARGEHCPKRYPTCPFSIMNIVKKYRNFVEGVSTSDDINRLSPPDPVHANFGIQNNHINIPEVVYH